MNRFFLSALLIASFAASIYLIFGGYKSNIWADAFSFFVMFGGFISIVIIANMNFGGAEFLNANLPQLHLTFTGGNSLTFIIDGKNLDDSYKNIHDQFVIR